MLIVLPRRGALAPSADHQDWTRARPNWIRGAVAHALRRSSGGWYVVDGSQSIREVPRRYVIEGRELVAWRAGGRAYVAPAACPHMGADLSQGRVVGTRLVCPWHGLRLGPEGCGHWQVLPAHDDGVLLWVRAKPGAATIPAPIQAPRPAHFVGSVVRFEGACEPEDVLANRLDPWHGVHFHPHSFARLRVLDVGEDHIELRVAYRLMGPLCIEVDVTFHSPEPRSIVMTILRGVGAGSVVSTHATPIRPGRTAIVEATVAAVDGGWSRVAERAPALLRRFLVRRASLLWREDLAYAERRYALRTKTQREAGPT